MQILTSISSYQIEIVFSDGKFYNAIHADYLLNAKVCYDESSYNASTYVWNDRTNNNNNTNLSSSCVLEPITNNNSTSTLNNVKLVGNVTVLNKTATNTASNFALFAVGRNHSTNSYFLCNNDYTPSHTFGTWETLYQSIYWGTRWLNSLIFEGGRAINNNVYTLFNDTSGNGYYYFNRSNSNAITNDGSKPFRAFPNVDFGRGYSSYYPGSIASIAFICFFNITITEQIARCIEYCLFVQYSITNKEP